MNTETTCCETPVADTAVSTPTESSSHLVLPVWSATKNDQGVELQVTLPGVSKNGLKLVARGSTLQLEARRELTADPEAIVYGSPAPDGYRLELRLGESLDAEGMTGKLTDGILEIAIPLVEAAQPRTIEVQ